MLIRCFYICFYVVIYLCISNLLRRYYFGYKMWYMLVIVELYDFYLVNYSSLIVVRMMFLSSVKICSFFYVKI